MPQEALRRCGIRYNTRLGLHIAPGFKTIKRAIRAVDAAAADEQLCAWLRAEAAAGVNWRHIAIDGRPSAAPSARRHTAPPPSAYDVTEGTVLGQADVNGKTNEITCFVPLLEAILTHPRHPGDSNSDDGGAAAAGKGKGSWSS